MIAHFTRFIKKHALFNPDDKILLAFSGGVDSVVLADLFYRAGFQFGLVHCNFSLRGKDSDLDEETAKTTAEIYKIPIIVKQFDTHEYARKNKLSIEMAARELRYDLFNKIKSKENYQYIATAHHLGDVLETILLNLTKGTGISGLRGIAPKREDIIRPLLFTTKTAIVQYAKDHHLNWRDDKSNEDNAFQRNLIRHKVVPELLSINPSLFETLGKSITRLRFAEKIYHETLSRLKGDIVQKHGKDYLLDKIAFTEEKEPAPLLFELIKEFGFNFDQCEEIIESLTKTGAIFFSHKYRLNIDRRYFFISPHPQRNEEVIFCDENCKMISDDIHQYFCTIKEVAGYTIRRNHETACLDFDLLKFPLQIRNWQHGDRFVPFGMKQKKKVSDFMIDEKIPLNLKERIKVLISGGEIVWIIGYRTDDRFKITPATKKVFEITAREI